MKNKKQHLLENHWNDDIVSGFFVALVALPLSLGIAGASGFPPIMGVLTAIVGGMIVSFFTGSELSIKGPAAGLIVIIYSAVEELGGGNHDLGLKLTSSIIIIAGLIQIVFGILKAAKLSSFFPIAAVHGMLAAIGIIIMSKQILLAEGISPKLLKGKETFDYILMIPETLGRIELHILSIAIMSILIMALWPKIKNKSIRKIPSALVVLFLAIFMGKIYRLETPEYGSLNPLVDPGNLHIEINTSILNLFSLSSISTIVKFSIMLSVVGAIESLLTGKAVELLDRYKRKSDLNKDLMAIGIGNMICGFLGALPMISEVVRSTTNINNGGKTRWANFFHGLFLLIFVALLTPFIKLIPVAALAGMLVFTGFKLASPSEFKHMKEVGIEQLMVFIVTILVTLLTDLLVGVGSGILLEIIFNLFDKAKFSELFKIQLNTQMEANVLRVNIMSPALFTNWNHFISQLQSQIAENGELKSIEINFSSTPLIDHTFMRSIHLLANSYNESQSISLKIIGLEFHKSISEHVHARRKLK
jgi:MFS superfamily sulfate permease-like transporter